MANIYSVRLERDERGRIRTKKEDINGRSVEWRYGYDESGRLSEVAQNGVGVERYTYDSAGRRSADFTPLRRLGGRDFEYGSDNRLLRAGNTRFAHDFAGFREMRSQPQGKTQYNYSPDYRLLSVQLPDGKLIRYQHNGKGLRIGKLVDGELIEQYQWHDRFHLAAWMHDGHWWTVVYERKGRPMALVRQDNGIALHLHTDQVGSVRAVEEPNQKMIKEIWYDSFGNVIRDSNPYLPCPLGFAGGLHDHDTGLVRFGWRDYEPDTGRFTAQDPLGAAGGDPDWYGYCLDDPVNAVDKTGLHGKFEKKDSVNDTRNIPSPKTRDDLAQPQLSIVGKNKIQQNDAPTASTIWGLEQSVNRGAALKELIGPDLERWGKTMKNAGPLVISVFEEGRKDGFEPADIPRGILKSFWIGE